MTDQIKGRMGAASGGKGGGKGDDGGGGNLKQGHDLRGGGKGGCC